MSDLQDLLIQTLDENLVQMVLSNSRNTERAVKVKVRPVSVKGNLMFQETLYRGTQVFHGNYSHTEIRNRLAEYMEQLFRQAQIITTTKEATVLVSKKGTVTIRQKDKPGTPSCDTEGNQAQRSLSHNRTKQYILQEGNPVDFLIGLGVQTKDGKIQKSRYDKFKQINRYLEFIEDVLDKLPSDRTIRIIDFGCGKSYLTFAMYYYLKEVAHRDIRVTGLDLKKDVIERCNALAEELGYEHLEFLPGDIRHYTGADKVDMVVSLHACDMATDYALQKAVQWGG